MADVRQGRLDAAAQHHESLAALARDPALEALMVWDRYSLALATRIAERTVHAEIALARGQAEVAIESLQEAVRIEDTIPYDEPPGWHAPVRHTLGAVLLAAGKPTQAEAVYREELRRNPENGWSLLGLRDSLAAQKRAGEARSVDAQLAAAWSNADVELVASRL
jgi:tetratricopeptide (TPR) repeat protein